MRGDLRVARLFGIDIYIDWSWLVIFVLIASDLALSLFARVHPEWGLALDWGLGIAAALLFFASVLLHELAHSVVARARGLPVKRIVLYLLGGASNIEREPPSAATEFVMALVGPLTSVLLGIIFLFLGRTRLGQLTQAMPTPLAGLAQVDALGTLLLWLGSANILIGIFNMIPAFPLDGGRVLRSLFWAFSNNLRRATLWSTWISHVIAWLFILGGIAMALGVSIPFFGAGLFNGLWLADPATGSNRRRPGGHTRLASHACGRRHSRAQFDRERSGSPAHSEQRGQRTLLPGRRGRKAGGLGIAGGRQTGAARAMGNEDRREHHDSG
jgi:Zn-dependent protease